jgi:hypothetical protein
MKADMTTAESSFMIINKINRLETIRKGQVWARLVFSKSTWRKAFPTCAFILFTVDHATVGLEQCALPQNTWRYHSWKILEFQLRIPEIVSIQPFCFREHSLKWSWGTRWRYKSKRGVQLLNAFRIFSRITSSRWNSGKTCRRLRTSKSYRSHSLSLASLQMKKT